MSNLIEFKDVWKTYKMGDEEVNALAGLDLTLKKGSFTAVMGPSGSGKSTFLHIAGILDMPTRGTFRINGNDTGKLSVKEQARLRRNEIGFIFQRFNLMSQLTVLENVMLPMIKEDSRKAEKLLDMMGLTGELDTRNADSIMHILQDLNQKDGVSIVMVTHNPVSADFADEVLNMRDGDLVSGSK